MGLVDEQRWTAFEQKREQIELEKQRLKTTWLHPGKIDDNRTRKVLGDTLKREHNLYDLLVRPNVSYSALMTLDDQAPVDIEPQVAAQLEIQARYGGYINRQREEVARLRKQETTRLPDDIDYAQVPGLSNEARQKLGDQRPDTIGQASRIPGLTPAAISLLLVHLKSASKRPKPSNDIRKSSIQS